MITSNAKPSEGDRGPPTSGGAQLRSVLETAAVVVAPTTLLTGLLFYFGRVYTAARLSYFGIDTSVVAFSTQEYLLRSIQPIFVPLGALALVALVLVWAHSTLMRWIREARHRRVLTALPPTLGVGGITLGAVGIAGLLGRPVFGSRLLVTPISLAFATIALSYAIYLWRRLDGARSDDPRWPSLASLTLVSLLVIVHVFWAMGDWAAGLGRGRGQELASELPYRAPGVILYSKDALGIDPATGVTVERVKEEGSPYRVRYQRLRMFLRSGGKYFLVPTEWSPSTGRVIVLPDNDAIRIEFTAP